MTKLINVNGILIHPGPLQTLQEIIDEEAKEPKRERLAVSAKDIALAIINYRPPLQAMSWGDA